MFGHAPESSRREPQRKAARHYRLLQAHALMILLERNNRRAAESVQQLEDWVRLRPDLQRPINPIEVLTRDEIRAAIRGSKGQRWRVVD